MTTEEYRRRVKSGDKRGKQPRNQHEHDHQATFFGVIDLPPNRQRFPFLEFVFAVPNAAKRSPKTAAMMTAEGLRSGVPDVIFPFCRREYPGAYMENKYGKNSLSPAQKRFRDHLLGEGYYFKSTKNADEQIDFAEWYLGIKLIR